jgi:hypothetical protein
MASTIGVKIPGPLFGWNEKKTFQPFGKRFILPQPRGFPMETFELPCVDEGRQEFRKSETLFIPQVGGNQVA